MRPLVQYLRSRGAAGALAAAVGSVAALAPLGVLLDSPSAARVCGQLAVAAVVAAAGSGLAGSDVELERTSALDWRWRRAAHAGVVVVIAFALVAATHATTQPLGQHSEIARNAVGAGGLLALGAVTLGASRARILPVAWIGTAPRLAIHLGPHLPVPLAQAVAWPVQPPESGVALALACALGGVGMLLYATHGPRGPAAADVRWARRPVSGRPAARSS